MLLDMHQALRCHAKSKRSRLQCRSPAVQGSSVCRMHGAGGGPPRGNRNALKHGGFTAETLAMKREISALARMARETMVAIE
jgi:glucans biosynthesis protein